MSSSSFWEIYGWTGTALVLLAFFLNSFGYVPASGLTYQLLNLVGGLGLAAISYRKKAYQPVAINIVWTAISLVAIVRALV